MELSEVDEPTIKAFLEWAYTKDYATPLPDTASALLRHSKVYVLADRFNTPILKELAYSRITALLADLGMITESADIEALLSAITFAFDSLPFSTVNRTPSSNIVAPSEKLLKYFAQYASWSLDVLREKTEFGALLLHCADFARALVTLSRGTATPPWSTSLNEDNEKTATSKSLQFSTVKNSNHPLCRYCDNCKYKGVASIKCPGCNYMDTEIGVQVVFDIFHAWRQ
ncbi:hypothetical protein BDZ91DRAFT_763775 [Kalaharituber pfeilii]|nr:hypothetical protein BDZ91DRAFT_763775 [Kalaharituber pfeilii]